MPGSAFPVCSYDGQSSDAAAGVKEYPKDKFCRAFQVNKKYLFKGKGRRVQK